MVTWLGDLVTRIVLWLCDHVLPRMAPGSAVA